MSRFGEELEGRAGVEFVQADRRAGDVAREPRSTQEILPDPTVAVAAPNLRPAPLAVDQPDLLNGRHGLVVVELAAEVVGARGGRQDLHDEARLFELPAGSNRFAAQPHVGLPHGYVADPDAG